MILDTTPKSIGRFRIMADVTDSSGCVAHVRVGRNYRTPQAAITAAHRFATTQPAGNIIVRNCDNDWMWTVRV